MINSLQSTTVKSLRKLAYARNLSKIYSAERGIVSAGRARKTELIAAIEAQESENQKSKVQEISLEMFKLSDEERVVVEEAMQVSGLSLLELAKAGLMMKARRVTTDLAKVQELTPEQRRNTTLRGAAQANLREIVDRIIAWNNACYDNKLRVYINASILRNLTGSNLNTIKEFIPIYRSDETIDQHNKRHGLTENDNRKGRDEFGHKIRISELIKLPIPQKTEEKEAASPVKNQAETQPVTIENLTPEEQFSQRIDRLESEAEIKKASGALMEELVAANSSKTFANFKKLVTPYRKEIESLRLRSHNSEAKLVSSDGGMKPNNWLKTHSELPKGAEFNEKGNIISYPVHVALKYLSPEIYKTRFAK